MQKQKHIFTAIFTAVLVIITSAVLLLYDNVKNNALIKSNIKGTQLDQTMQLFTLAKAKELDPQFEVVTFQEDVPIDVQRQLKNDLEAGMQQAVYTLENDPNFIYELKNTQTQKTSSRNMNLVHKGDDVKKYSVYSAMHYDRDGIVKTKNKANSLYYNQFDIKNLMDGYIQMYYSQDNTFVGYTIYDVPIESNDIIIHTPKNLEVTYIVPAKPKASGFVYSFLTSWEAYNEFSATMLTIGTALLVIFFLFYPIKIVEEAQPFASVKKWKAAVQIFLLGWGITFALMCALIITGNTLTDYLKNLLLQYEIGYTDILIMAANFIVWFFTFYLISIAIFQIKYIFAHGIGRYLKEDTLIGSLFRKIKNQIHQLMEIDLNDNVQKNLMKLVLLHMFIIMLISTTWTFGYILSILYACIVFGWLKKRLDKLQQDYQKIQGAMHALGQGNFEIQIQEDVGMFHSLKDEFSNIRSSFEKAVKEETKSQNMKTELISNVSHDLKTPLTCIKNYIVLLQDDSLDETTRHEYLNNLNQYSNRLTTLIEDLFDVSKVNSGNIKLDRMDINFIALIEQAHAECSDLLEEKHLQVITSYAQSEMSLYLDGGKTYRILENLFTNIAKYAMPSSRVYIDVTETDTMVQSVFKNISASQMNFTADEIVDRFVRGDKSRHEGGSGLGLAIVKSFVEVQGGQFNIAIDGDLFKATITFPKTIE